MLNLNDLKQIFFEEETRAQIERIKQEHEQTKQQLKQAQFELAKAKHEHQKQQQEARLEILKAKEQRQKEQHEQKLKQAQKQQQADNITYIISISITFLSVFISFILFMAILLKG